MASLIAQSGAQSSSRNREASPVIWAGCRWWMVRREQGRKQEVHWQNDTAINTSYSWGSPHITSTSLKNHV
jgi:hypothetical protein